MANPVIPANFSVVRAQSYVYRLPLFTRSLLFLIVAAWFAKVALKEFGFDLKAWGALVPEEVGITSCMSQLTLVRAPIPDSKISMLSTRTNNADKVCHEQCIERTRTPLYT